MSVTNKALLNLTQHKKDQAAPSSLSPASIPNIESKYKAPFFFAIGVLSSLSLVGWVSVTGTIGSSLVVDDYAHTQVGAIPSQKMNMNTTELTTSPTQKVPTVAISRIYSEKKNTTDSLRVTEPSLHNINTRDSQHVASVEVAKSSSIVPATPKEQAEHDLLVEEVDVFPSELAQRSREAAKKALDKSDFTTATKEYYTVLKYQPRDEDSRKRLAALLYGKRDVAEAASVLQQGIKLNNDSIELRLALSSLLQKEQQPEAALSALEYVPVGVSIDYLATRGALAQQLKLMDLAKESYQMLVNQDPDNGRWWLGLAIVYEREAKVKAAYDAYQTAIMTPGLSRSSQAFVRDRIKLLATMEGVE